jgi:hypothetical protein
MEATAKQMRKHAATELLKKKANVFICLHVV